MSSKGELRYSKLLAKEDCDFFVEKLFGLQKHWIKRTTEVSSGGLYTLGMASYLDGSTFDKSIDKIAEQNKVLKENFSPLFKIVRDLLSHIYGCKTYLGSESNEYVTLPGFHIYLPTDAFKLKNYYPYPHIDAQYKYIFDGKGICPEQVVACTTSLRVPPKDSGLEVWTNSLPISPDELDDVDSSERSVWDPKTNTQRNFCEALSTGPDFVEYSDGGIAVHDGLQFHRPVIMTTDDCPRITLQMHGIKLNDGIQLFW